MPLAPMVTTAKIVFARTSAFACGSLVLILGAFYIATWVYLIVKKITEGSIDLRYPPDAATVVVLLAPDLYFGAALGRFLLRAAPPRIDGKVRVGVLFLPLPLAGLCIVLSVLFLVSHFVIRPAPGEGSPLMYGSLGLALLIWGIGVSVAFYKRQVRPLFFLDKAFVLFLRRFSDFSDRTLIALLLKQTRRGKPIVFLVPSRSRAGDWNPFLVGFAGMKFFDPFRGAPIILETHDKDWEQAARLLIDRAQIIAFDITSVSEAIKEEAEMISRADCFPKTVLLKDRTTNEADELEKVVMSKAGHVIYYQKSWLSALPRMVVGFIAVTYPLPMTLFLLEQTSGNSTLFVLELLFLLPTLVWCYCIFFVRPSIDRASRTLLNRMWDDNNIFVNSRQPGGGPGTRGTAQPD